jgi:hypothetical protein
MKHYRFIAATFAVCALALSACSGNTVKDTLGLNKASPDEYRVVSRPPLSVPPQFNLRPPGSAPESPTAMAPADKQAKSLLTGVPANGSFTLPPSGDAVTAPVPASSKAVVNSPESQFLKNAGADKANPNIRTTLEEDKATASVPEVAEEECSWWELMCSYNSEKKDPTVDAKKEADRIKQDKAAGKPVTTGDTPDVPQKDTGLLGSIFGY